jgi:hypothetical protein
MPAACTCDRHLVRTRASRPYFVLPAHDDELALAPSSRFTLTPPEEVDAPLLLSERIDPSEIGEAAEVGVVRVKLGVMLDGERRELDIRGEVSSGADAFQHPEGDLQLPLARPEESNVRLSQPVPHVVDRCIHAKKCLWHALTWVGEGRQHRADDWPGRSCDVRLPARGDVRIQSEVVMKSSS